MVFLTVTVFVLAVTLIVAPVGVAKAAPVQADVVAVVVYLRHLYSPDLGITQCSE